MPDSTQSQELRELRTSFDPAIREIETVEIVQRPPIGSRNLDLVFVMDTTGSMGGYLELVADTLAGVAAGIAESFDSVKYAIIDFKDEEETVVALGSLELADLAATQTALDGLAASGGDDAPENGFGALFLAASLPFREDSSRAAILITDETSHERGKTLAEAQAALLASNVTLFTLDGWATYSTLATLTGGAVITDETEAGFEAAIVEALGELATLPLEDPVYLVNDNVDFAAKLETGEDVIFLRRSFTINPFSSGEDGALSISITVDNTDLEISRYLARAKSARYPIEVIFRVYLSNDNLGPANNPPLVLYISETEIRGSVVSANLRWVDITNAPFPNSYYNAKRCPSLQ
jgi:hypothetical protein